MTESTNVSLNLQSPNISTVVYAVQNDKLSRHIVAQLRDGSAAWTPPAGALAAIRYLKPDGTGGFYDVDENNDPAISVSGSVATLTLAEQCTTIPGDVYMQLNFYGTDGSKLTTFCWILRVQKSVLADATIISSDYYNVLTAAVAQVAADRAAVEAIAASITLPWPIESGGTNATTPGAALSNLGGIRPNLLDNWYFIGGGSQNGAGYFPINQRGQTSYSIPAARTTTVDRWYGYRGAGSGTIQVTGSGVALSSTDMYFGQIIPTDLTGKMLTLSILLSDGTFVTGSATVPASNFAGAYPNFVCSTIVESGKTLVQLYFYSSAFTIVAIKAEIGEAQTLAHQENGTWVLNEVPSFASELTKCRRYYRSLVTTGASTVAADLGTVIPYDTGNAVISFPFDFAQAPTITCSGLKVSQTAYATGADSTLQNAYCSNGFTVCEILSSGLTGGQAYRLLLPYTGGYVVFDADLR